MSTGENVAVIYSMGGYEPHGSIPCDEPVCLTGRRIAAPIEWTFAVVTRVVTAREWDGSPAVVRDGDRAIPVRLVGGAR